MQSPGQGANVELGAASLVSNPIVLSHMAAKTLVRTLVYLERHGPCSALIECVRAGVSD